MGCSSSIFSNLREVGKNGYVEGRFSQKVAIDGRSLPALPKAPNSMAKSGDPTNGYSISSTKKNINAILPNKIEGLPLKDPKKQAAMSDINQKAVLSLLKKQIGIKKELIQILLKSDNKKIKDCSVKQKSLKKNFNSVSIPKIQKKEKLKDKIFDKLKKSEAEFGIQKGSYIKIKRPSLNRLQNKSQMNRSSQIIHQKSLHTIKVSHNHIKNMVTTGNYQRSHMTEKRSVFRPKHLNCSDGDSKIQNPIMVNRRVHRTNSSFQQIRSFNKYSINSCYAIKKHPFNDKESSYQARAVLNLPQRRNQCTLIKSSFYQKGEKGNNRHFNKIRTSQVSLNSSRFIYKRNYDSRLTKVQRPVTAINNNFEKMRTIISRNNYSKIRMKQRMAEDDTSSEDSSSETSRYDSNVLEELNSSRLLRKNVKYTGLNIGASIASRRSNNLGNLLNKAHFSSSSFSSSSELDGSSSN